MMLMFKSKKLITSIFLAIMLIASFTLFAFADDSASVPDSSGSAAEYSSAEIEFINSSSDDNDRDIRILATNIARSTTSTYTIDDIYNLLLAVYTTYSGRASWAVFDQSIYNEINNNFSHYDSDSGNTYDTGAMLWLVKNSLRDIALELVPANANSSSTIYQLIDNMNTALSSINYNVSLGLIDGNGTPYLVNIYNKLNDISLNSINYTNALWFNSLGCAEYLSQIKSLLIDSNNLSIAQRVNALVQIENNFANNMNLKVGSIDTKLNTTNNNLNTINNTASNVKSSVDTVNTSLQSFYNDFNNISWNNFGDIVGSSVNNEYTTNFITPGTTSSDFYFSFVPSGSLTGSFILFYLPVRIPISANRSVDFYYTQYGSGSYVNVDYLFIESHNPNGSYLLVYNLPCYENVQFIMHLKFDYYIYYNSITPSVKYISFTSSDFYDVYNMFINTIHYNTWKKLYASDDIINAKEAQKPLEDSVLEDFTGSGSASASVADAVDVKGVQSSVKGSLNTGDVRPSGLSTILNTNNPSSSSSFFTFWTSTCANDINGTDLIPQTRDIYYHLNDDNTMRELIGGQFW